MKYKAFGRSDTGKVRANNEDAFFVSDKDGIFIVADGMGGHNAGEIASDITCKIIPPELTNLESDSNVEDSIRKAMRTANERVCSIASQNSAMDGMGCTCALLLLRDHNYFIAHVGDSRVYLFRKGRLKSMTRDHSYTEELYIRGLISAEEKDSHPYKNQITRYIGCADELEVDITSGPLWNGDVFLLCTDGLTGELEEKHIEKILSHEQNPVKAVDKLIESALANGGHDNVSAVVVKIIDKQSGFFKTLFSWWS